MMWHAEPPPAWRQIIASPLQSAEFARAAGRLGYRSFFCTRGRQAALVQLRDPLPALGWLARAYVYPSGEDRAFVAAIVEALAGLRIPYVRIGNTMCGVREAASLELPRWRPRVVPRQTTVIDVRRPDRDLLAAMTGAARKIRKAEQSGVEVREAAGEADVVAYHALSRATASRIRAASLFTELPLGFFLDVYRHMVCAGSARLFLARADGQLLAGTLCLVQGDTMLYFQGASTRDRAHTARQAPAACFWTGIRAARAMGLARFDFGGFTPTADPGDPRRGVYDFKRRWGGAIEEYYNAEIPLLPRLCRFQERVAGPLWQRLHPLVWRLAGRGMARPA